jgi:hypothetical protein
LSCSSHDREVAFPEKTTFGKASILSILAIQKGSEPMHKKSAILARPSSTNSVSRQKKVAATEPHDPTPNGEAVSEQVIRLRAFQKWEAAGKPGGDSVKFWLEAEREVLQAK